MNSISFRMFNDWVEFAETCNDIENYKIQMSFSYKCDDPKFMNKVEEIAFAVSKQTPSDALKTIRTITKKTQREYA